MLIVQELCTKGNLKEGISSGLFHCSNAAAGTQAQRAAVLDDVGGEPDHEAKPRDLGRLHAEAAERLHPQRIAGMVLHVVDAELR